MNKLGRRIFKIVLKQKLLFVSALVLTILQVISTLMIPIIIGYSIDNIISINNVDFEALYKNLFVLIVLVIFASLFGYLMQITMSKVTNHSLKSLRDECFSKLLVTPISYIDSHPFGDTLIRVTSDVEQLGDGLLQALTQLLSGVFTIVFTLVFMMLVNYQVGLIVICLTPLSLATAYLIAKFSFKTFKEQSKIKGELSSHYSEMFDMSKEIIAYGYQEEAIKKAEIINGHLEKVGIKAQFLSSLVNPTTRFVNALVYASVGIYGSLKAITGSFSVGELQIFLNYANSYTKPFNEISGVVAEIQNSFAAARRIFEIIDLDLVEDKNEELEVVDGHIEFKNVDFSYIKNKPLLTNLNLEANKGEVVAIVGSTGSGKTTIINLLMRFYDLDSGMIIIDNQDISQYSSKSLRDNIGMVLQDTWLFNGTIFENIAYGNKDLTLSDIKRAAKAVYADNFIESLPQGYDTIIDGTNSLSAGERQLICIARLMLKSPKILVLDEATSSIDTHTEILIQKAFINLMKDKTTFIIAHRLATIINADKIIVLDKGKIVEVGKHHDLLKLNGYYRKIYDSQFKSIK